MRIFIFLLFIFLSFACNFLIANPSTEYFERIKGKGFIGKVGAPNKFAGAVWHRVGVTTAEDGKKTIIGSNYLPSYVSRDHLISLAYDEASNEYFEKQSSLQIGGYETFRVVEIEGKEQIWLSNSGELWIYDPITLFITSKYDIDLAGNFEVADLDNDGTKELINITSPGFITYDLKTFEKKFEINLYDSEITDENGNGLGGNFKVADVDDDGKNEVVMDGYASVFEISPTHHITLEMRLRDKTQGYTSMILNTHDLNGDGVPEVIAGLENPDFATSGWKSQIRVFDLKDKQEIGYIETSLPVLKHEFLDVNDDGVKEILVANDRFDVIAYDYKSESEVKRYPSFEGYGCAGLIVDDFDNDQEEELFFSCGHNGTGQAYNYIYSKEGVIEWQKSDLNGPFYLGGFSDSDKQDLIALSSRKHGWSADGNLIKLNSNTLEETWNNNDYDYGVRDTQDGFRDLVLEDVNDDGFKDAIFGKGASELLTLHIFDTKEEQFLKNIEFTVSGFGYEDPVQEYIHTTSQDIAKLKLLDINNDKKNELIVATQAKGSGVNQLKLYIYDLENDSILEEYNIPNYGEISEILLDDYDQDGVLDLIILQGYLGILDRSSKSMQYSEKGYYTALNIIDSKYYAANFEGFIFEMSTMLNELNSNVLCGPGEINTIHRAIDFEVINDNQWLTLCMGTLGLFDSVNMKEIGVFEVGQSLFDKAGEIFFKKNGNFFDIYFETYNGIEHFKDSDFDDDGIGNILDPDDDNDGILDQDDTVPLGLDFDGDGIADSEDPDDDNDGVLDVDDVFPFDASESSDNDSDGTGDNADTDDDNDGVTDNEDAFPLNSAESSDNDSDGIGDNADTDDDNDGMPDDWEEQYGLDPLSASDRDTDADSDGASNFEEYQAGTDPTVANNTGGGGANPPPTTTPPSSGGGGGATSLLLLLMILAFAGRRYYR